MKLSVIELPIADREGKIKKSTIENCHCISCGSFVSSLAKEPASVFGHLFSAP